MDNIVILVLDLGSTQSDSRVGLYAGKRAKKKRGNIGVRVCRRTRPGVGTPLEYEIGRTAEIVRTPQCYWLT